LTKFAKLTKSYDGNFRLCVGLDKLGGGIALAQNPIKDEEMMKKYTVGVDHLFDYLEKRLERFGAFELPRVRVPDELLSNAERTQKKSTQDFHLKLLDEEKQEKNKAKQQPAAQSEPKKTTIVMDIDTELSTKLVVLKNWGISTIRGELSGKLSRMKNYLARATQPAEVLPLAQFAKNIKPAIETARGLLIGVPNTPARDPPPGTDRLTVLKNLVQISLEDINFLLEAFFAEFQKLLDAKIVLGMVQFVKEVKREVGYVTIV